MMIKNSLLIAGALLTAIASGVAFAVWQRHATDRPFECAARVYTKVVANTCNKSSVVDVFLSMQGGKGELLVSGTHACPKTPLTSLHGSARFTYTREGSYYQLHLLPRSPELVELFDVLKDDDFKLKITPLNSNDYMLETPIKTVLLCTAE